MIAITTSVVTDLTEGTMFDRAGQELLMASHPLGPGAVPPSEWHTSAHVYTHSHLMACLRAGLIALALLAVLVFIVLT
jgi:hypothetical protein